MKCEKCGQIMVSKSRIKGVNPMPEKPSRSAPPPPYMSPLPRVYTMLSFVTTIRDDSSLRRV